MKYIEHGYNNTYLTTIHIIPSEFVRIFHERGRDFIAYENMLRKINIKANQKGEKRLEKDLKREKNIFLMLGRRCLSRRSKQIN